MGSKLFEINSVQNETALNIKNEEIKQEKLVNTTINRQKSPRIPLIKFKGPRKYSEMKIELKSIEPELITKPSLKINDFDTINQLPRKYQTYLNSDEIEAVEVKLMVLIIFSLVFTKSNKHH